MAKEANESCKILMKDKDEITHDMARMQEKNILLKYKNNAEKKKQDLLWFQKGGGNNYRQI